MSDQSTDHETLDDFAASLSYGQRSDLSFKFLGRFEDSEVGDVVAELLHLIGDVVDTGDAAGLIGRVIERQAEGYRSRSLSDRYHYDDAPFVQPAAPVASATVALVTSSGHFVAGDDPEPLSVAGMSQEEAERRIEEFLKEPPVLSAIPLDVPRDQLRVRHGGYDVRGALRDHNVVLPLDRLQEAASSGVIGSVYNTAFSFVGACAQTRLVNHIGPEWANSVASTGSDVVLLVPV